MLFSGKMDRTGDHHVKGNNADSERQILHVFSHVWNLDLKKKDMRVEGRLFGKIVWRLAGEEVEGQDRVIVGD
jgi:hypothetical protein